VNWNAKDIRYNIHDSRAFIFSLTKETKLPYNNDKYSYSAITNSENNLSIFGSSGNLQSEIYLSNNCRQDSNSLELGREY